MTQLTCVHAEYCVVLHESVIQVHSQQINNDLCDRIPGIFATRRVHYGRRAAGDKQEGTLWSHWQA